MKFFSRVSIVFVFCLLFFSALFAKPAQAQTTQTPLSSFSTANVSPDVPRDIHSLAQIVTSEVISTMICQLSGIDTTSRNGSCIGVDPQTHQIGFLKSGNGGLIGVVFSGIQFEFNIPIHSTDYLQYMAGRFGIAPHAYAAAPTGGVGFTGLKPLLGLWVAFRNIVYIFFVIIFVLVGIAIMLRIQIDPRTVMTLENQLPKIVIGLILVTFSYAIAGVLIDVMWVLTFLVVNVLTATDSNAVTNTTNNATSLTNVATTKLLEGPMGYVNDMMASNGAGGVLDLAGSAARAAADVLRNMITGDTMQKIGINSTVANTSGCSPWQQGFGIFFPPASAVCAIANVPGDVATMVGQVVGWVVGWVLGSLAALVILIALLITLFRVWFTLLQAYAFIILDVILAPFYIAAGLIPGSTIGLSSWLRGIASNLLVFPSTVFMFVLARVLLDTFYGTANTAPGAGGGALFQPPLIGGVQGNGAGNPLGAIVALAVIFATPEVLTIVRNALQVKDNGFGAAAGRSVATGPASARRIGSGFTTYLHNPLDTGPGGRLGRLFQSVLGG